VQPALVRTMLYILMKLLGVEYKIEGLEDGKLGEVFDSDNNKITGEMAEIIKKTTIIKLNEEMDTLIKEYDYESGVKELLNLK
jgi:hypothetical protein